MMIGTRLLKLRKEHRFSQTEVAARIGVCQSTYCAWESDRATPSARHYSSLAALFGLDLQELIVTDSALDLPLRNTAPLPLVGLSPMFQDDLIHAQRETIALQKYRIEHLETENENMRQQLITAGKLAGSTLIFITSFLNFISLLIEPISELIVTC